MNNKQLTKLSRHLSYVLRHVPESIGLELDKEGWANVDALLAGLVKDGQTIDRDILLKIVETDDKGRYSLSADQNRIRAVQGHSTAEVALSFKEVTPADVLYHGTATKYLDSINAFGLLPMTRHHVHLSLNKDTAITVGERHGNVAVLQIAAHEMWERGYKFFEAENGVWLTEAVPAEFITQL